MDAAALRRANLRRLGSGFRVASSLPLPDLTRTLRTPDRIAGRLLAIYAVFSWAAPAWSDVADADIRARVERDDLRAHMTPSERVILRKKRARAVEEHGDAIGWRLENMWPLAWALGHHREPEERAARQRHGARRLSPRRRHRRRARTSPRAHLAALAR